MSQRQADRLDRAITYIERAGQLLARLTLALGAITLLAMLVLTVADVFGRYVMNAPINGANELLRFLIGGVIFLALPVVTATDEQITVDLLDHLYSDRIAAIRRLIVDVVSAVALIILADWIVFRADRLANYGYVSDFLHLPLAPMAYFIAFMTVVTGVGLGIKAIIDAILIFHPRLSDPSERAESREILG
jgi:TRAP-type C4-dicarboxylate transport system permease small subunit